MNEVINQGVSLAISKHTLKTYTFNALNEILGTLADNFIEDILMEGFVHSEADILNIWRGF